MGQVVFAPALNSVGRSDSTGAFIPEARAFLSAHGSSAKVHLFDNSLPMRLRRADVADRLAREPPGSVNVLAFFCHGWRDGIQAGYRLADVRALAEHLAPVAAPLPTIVLYACDAGRDGDAELADDQEPGPGGEGGFADALRAAMVRAGVRATIFAHTRPGHTTRNPHVRRFLPDEMGGGNWVVTPGSRLWPRWVQALRETTLRFRFPFMADSDLEAELQGVA